MATRFPIRSFFDRCEQMQKDNKTQPSELIQKVVHSLRDGANSRVVKMIPTRFIGATMDDAGILEVSIKNAIEDMFTPSPTGKAGIIITGPAGSGKTHIAVAMMKWIASKDPEVVAFFGIYPQIIQELRVEASDGSSNESGSMWDKLTNESGLFSGLIVIDDIGSAKPTDFELEKLFSIIDRRTNEFFPTIITTNIPPDQFESVFGARISSRLLGYFTIVNTPDHDYRDSQ